MPKAHVEKAGMIAAGRRKAGGSEAYWPFSLIELQVPGPSERSYFRQNKAPKSKQNKNKWRIAKDDTLWFLHACTYS